MRPRHLQLHRHRSLRHHFAELGKIAFRLAGKSQANHLIAGEAVDDGIERAIEENLSVIDNHHPIAQLCDVLHIMTGQERDDAVFGIINAQEFAHPFLANDI